MSLSIFKRVTALTVAGSVFACVAMTVATAAPRGAARPVASDLKPNVKADAEQVLSEGGAASALYIGNLMDVVGAPIACPGTAFLRDCAAESSIPTKAATNPQYIYAANGAGAAQLDFVSQKSGAAAKTAQTPEPVPGDANDTYSNVAPIGYTTGWAGTAASTTAADTLHFASGDSPIPLGPAENSAYVPAGFVDYATSLAAFNGGGDTTGGGYNANRGPAVVQPILGTGISVIFNVANLTVPAGGLNLTQDDVCAIFTGVYTNWNQTSANPGTQAITIVHRSDGSGNTFVLSYALSKICSSSNPAIAAGVPGAPQPSHYWGNPSNLLTQGVGTDSNNISGTGVIPTDTTAPEVVWPFTSVPAAKSSGELTAVENTPGAIGYISPAYTVNANISEVNVENIKGGFEPANATTIGAAFTTFASANGVNPPGYPASTKSEALYFPFPTSPTGAAIVGFSYGYFYQCTPTREALQVAAIKKLWEYETAPATSGTAATIAAFWNFTPLPSSELTLLKTALTGLKSGPFTNGAYTNPATGAKARYNCTAQ
jgi:ABC-type phosphate transport system substrate-binding protein